MAAIDTWVLDGVDLTATNFSMMEFTADPPKEKPEWMTGADSEWSALSRQPKHENRVVTMKLRVRPQASMDAALDQVGVIVDKLRKASATSEGVPLVWTPANSARTVTFDVLQGEIQELPISMEGQGRSWLMQRPIFTLEMSAKPYYRYAETVSSITLGTTPLVTREITGTTGDVPALGRLIVIDNANQSRWDVEWGLEARNYNAATSLIVDSDSMVTSNYAGTQTTRTGSYDPNATGNNVIRASSVLDQPVPICNTGVLAHVGTFRVWGRFWLSRAAHNVRLRYRVAEGDYKANPWVGFGTANFSRANRTQASALNWTGQWVELDLGVIRIPKVTSGTQGWDGIIETYENKANVTSVGSVDVDYLMLVPVDEGWGRARAKFSLNLGQMTHYDRFTSTTAGSALNGRVAPLGGTWATSGSTTDFVFFDPVTVLPTETVKRETTGDVFGSPPNIPGRFAILGATNSSLQAVSANFLVGSTEIATNVMQLGVIARWVDLNNYLSFRVSWSYDGNHSLTLGKLVAGTETILSGLSGTQFPEAPSYEQWFNLLLVALDDGRIYAQLGFLNNGVVQPTTILEAFDTDVDSGALATGKPGFYDTNTSSTAVARYVDDFLVTQPIQHFPVLFSGEKIEFRHDTVLKEGAAAGVYNPESIDYRGTRFVVPPGTSRVAVKARRQDNEEQSVVNISDSTGIQVGVTHRGLVVPR